MVRGGGGGLPAGAHYPRGFDFPVVIVPTRIAVVELVRELASLLLLAAAARLSARSFAERFAAFALLFGVWDLVYYAMLKLILGWPEGWGSWDILFLLPLPWIGPVWAPCLVSVALIAFGTRVLSTPEIPRRWNRREWALAVAGGLLVVASFVAGWRVVVDQRIPESFPAPLFVLGFLLAGAAFLISEMRLVRAAAGTGPPA